MVVSSFNMVRKTGRPKRKIILSPFTRSLYQHANTSFPFPCFTRTLLLPHYFKVRAFVFDDNDQEKESGGGADCHKQAKGHWIVDSDIANPMSVYEQYRSSRTSWGIDAMGSVIVEVELSNGMIGVGISIGGDAACFIVEKHLSRFAKGQDPSNVELIWDQCWRATMNYGRKGIAIQALSALDLAIWDALGHLRGLPVYQMLGGKTKERMPVYATTASPLYAKQLGFHGAKIPLPFGPANGQEGMKKNIEHIKFWRESVGPEFPLSKLGR
jgi:L-rhamnonate dehydratase